MLYSCTHMSTVGIEGLIGQLYWCVSEVWTDSTDPFGFVSVVDDWLVGCAVMMMTMISCC